MKTLPEYLFAWLIWQRSDYFPHNSIGTTFIVPWAAFRGENHG